MCHNSESRPPAPPVVGQVAAHGPIALTATDGTPLTAYCATPAEARGTSIVILPDVRGLHPFYRELTVRFAEAGYETVALDHFDRLVGPGERGDDFDYKPLVDQVRPDDVAADVRIAADDLATRGAGPTFTVGFCFGGGLSWRMAAAVPELAGAIGFYGILPTAAEVVDQIERPILMLLGGEDRATSPADFNAFAERLDERDVTCEKHVYDGAPHAFFDRSFAEHADACVDAWQRILHFTDRHGGRV